MAQFFAAIFIFLTVILIHELGHFLMAKFVGIKVNEFSIGMGPLIYKKQYGETQYSFRILPIGGFVSMAGEDKESDDPRGFSNAKLKDKILVIIAGAFMNFMLAIFIFSIVYFSMGVPSTKVGGFTDVSVAKEAGLEINDEIESINGRKIDSWYDITEEISNSSKDENLNINVIRDDETLNIEVKPLESDGRMAIGILPMMERGIISAVSMGFQQTLYIITMLLSFFKSLLTGKIGIEMLSGPVGVISEIGVATQYGIIAVLNFLAFMSVNLGFFNLLPIPALDGGRLMFLIVEAITGKSIKEETEGFIHFIGFVLLITLMLVVTFKDIFTLYRP